MGEKATIQVSADKAMAFREWLTAGLAFCERSELDELVARVMARQRAFLTALETTATVTTQTATRSDAPRAGSTRRALRKPAEERRARGGAKPTTSAYVVEALRGHPDATGHDLAAMVRMHHSKIPGASIHAALFRLVTSGKVKKTGERGAYHYAVNEPRGAATMAS